MHIVMPPQTSICTPSKQNQIHLDCLSNPGSSKDLARKFCSFRCGLLIHDLPAVADRRDFIT
eukprot:1150356-Pelagomonas_calceolata.AAC.4